MIIVGFVLFAAVVVLAVALIVQNPATVPVRAFSQAWNVDMRWLVVAGLALTAIGLFGLGMMRRGSARQLRLRGERRALMAENKRLTNGRLRLCQSAPRLTLRPRTASVAPHRESVPSASSSDRGGFRERLVDARHRLVRS
jgi:hypothetical protein